MKQITLSFIILLFISACTQVNSTGEKTVTDEKDSTSEIDISLSKMDAVEELSNVKEEEKSQLLFKAEGAEPGWTAEFYSDRLTMVLNYGKETVTIKRLNNDLNKKEDVKINLQSGASDFIIIQTQSCMPMSGEPSDKKVEITYKGTKYKGCGMFLK